MHKCRLSYEFVPSRGTQHSFNVLMTEKAKLSSKMIARMMLNDISIEPNYSTRRIYFIILYQVCVYLCCALGTLSTILAFYGGNAVIAVNGGFLLQTVIIVYDIPHIALTQTVFPLQARYRHISRNGIANFTVNITYWLISMLLTIVGLISHFNVYLCRYFNVDEVYDLKTQWY